MLPKTKRWRAIVIEIAAAEESSGIAPKIAKQTLEALGARYRDLAKDESVQTAFSYLVEIARSACASEPEISLSENTPLSLVGNLVEKLTTASGSLETRELVRCATADALATWYREHSSTQTELFGSHSPRSAWEELGSGAGFCELSRLYFAHLTERYLNYFLDREASSVLPDLSSRETFQNRLRDHVTDVSRISFESAKIAQSFAAGWFNKHAQAAAPSTQQKRKFLAYAFDKLREEFRREGEK